ncbi:uncharacterized protein [Spinacia oleracea]|uniref:TTF-type domain-containing protein n=1 Tax=Spinacia oleracea TaxID=3562 RepID=A0ABM3QZB4_SPIOL|nr:uncharacterized protein LOC130463565 [Spinacia oleracea]
MIHFHPSDKDTVIREYIQRELCQPKTFAFPFGTFRQRIRRFNPKWFDDHGDWLEYSIEKDATYCFGCYLFKKDNAGRGEVKERFLGIIHVANTVAATLKDAIESLLMEHSLSSINGLKTLILNDSPSAYCVHCFSQQLQLTLVVVAKNNTDCSWLFVDVLPLFLNFVGGSPKRKEFLREIQA